MIDVLQAKQEAITARLRDELEEAITNEMGVLYNQFVIFIAASKVPLPSVLVVLEMLKKETIDQAYRKYKGE